MTDASCPSLVDNGSIFRMAHAGGRVEVAHGTADARGIERLVSTGACRGVQG